MVANELELFYWWFRHDVTGRRLRTLHVMGSPDSYRILRLVNWSLSWRRVLRRVHAVNVRQLNVPTAGR